ncbi:radical SAM protein [candidate division KSB1 bacterium]|nr:radical SAM protein [candidate division KSB1 bacterium]
MKHIFFGIQYLINHHIFKKNTPLICGLTVTNKCNLSCRHCRIARRGIKNMRYEETLAVIDSFYNEGGRTLYLQGGEPFLWHDGKYNLEDIVDYSHKVGFFTTIIYTNGTIPLETSADTVFVSIDGLQKIHDSLRGRTFDRILKNIIDSNHPSLYINFTINNFNKDEIQDFCEFIHEIHQIRGVFFYFHTPYYGLDDLYIESVERNKILLKLMQYKKKYKILNSRAGLKSALKNDWKRPLDICRVYEKGKTYKCCRFPGDPELCRNCGYLSYAEINQTLKLKPSAILNALKYF